jgi:protein arginine kinase
MNDAQAVLPDESIHRGAPWLSGTGGDCDVVISSRLRMARNLAGFPFAGRCAAAQLQQVLDLCREGLRVAGVRPVGPGALAWVEVHRLSQLARTLLVERHLISKEHAKGQHNSEGPGTPRGVAFTLPDESLSIMVNEEDHLRLQVLRSGQSLAEALALADRVDDQIESALDFAFQPRLGYLTACPTNVGCGVRMSVMLHLPGLKLTGEIEKMRKAAKDLQLAVRGFYGEGSDAVGDLYQISNQTTLGKAEAGILQELTETILPEVIGYERLARRILLEKRRRVVEDQIFRAWGTLRSARLLAPEEALSMLSLARLGVLMGLIREVDEPTVTQLFLLAQPAHLQRFVGRVLDQQERREARADLIRHRLGG